MQQLLKACNSCRKEVRMKHQGKLNLLVIVIQKDQGRIQVEADHGVIWVGRNLKDHLVPTPCQGDGHLPLDQVPQSSIHPLSGMRHPQPSISIGKIIL